MSFHIDAPKGSIAPKVIISGDPLRAKSLAQRYLSDLRCTNERRGMLGFTGKYQGEEVSIHGTGMGIPSTAIYVNELIRDYGVKTLVRVGTCGSYQAELAVGSVVLAMSASTDSAMNKKIFKGMDYAPTADWSLLSQAASFAQSKDISITIGSVLSTDHFYNNETEEWKFWADYGVLAVEMEASCLYTLAAKHKARALTVLTVSDSFITREEMSAEAKEQRLDAMAQIALSLK